MKWAKDRKRSGRRRTEEDALRQQKRPGAVFEVAGCRSRRIIYSRRDSPATKTCFPGGRLVQLATYTRAGERGARLPW
jgi:hypothetical protein